MSLPKTKRALDKINALYKSMSLDTEGISAIERDLMLSYVRQLYEVFQEESTAAPSSSPSVPAYTPRPEPPRPPAPEPKPQPRPEPVRYQPRERSPEPPPPPPRPSQPEPVQPTPAPAYQPSYTPPPRYSSASPAVRALFDHQQARELSEKLSERPIEDLTKAMTINDRLLYANELFRGDSQTMGTTLDQLNRFRSMEEARPLLENLATQNDWSEGEREETARSFIKLVRRRYN